MALERLSLRFIYYRYKNGSKSICSGRRICVKSNRKNGQRIWLLLMLFNFIWYMNLFDDVQGYSLQQHHQLRQQNQKQSQQYNKFIESKMSNQMADTTKTVKKQLGKYQQQQQQLQQQYEPNKPLENAHEINAGNNEKEQNGQEQQPQLRPQQQSKLQQQPQQQHQQQQSQQIIDDTNALNETNEIMNGSQENNLLSSDIYQGKTILYETNVADISDTLKTGFYFFLALSTIAIVVILCKVYRLRLSRAERKYGVQGDHTTQELTPLPMAIDDGHSDDDDHTLFDIQRQQLRIF